ncbi:MAG: integrase [Hyphomicrobiaceae bacterium]|nr:integrase [Hyphomicrobiaceae bacterium]
MDALTFGLMGLCRHGRDGSFATRSNREDMLAMMAADLKAGGFKLPTPASLKPKHVEFLIERWRADGITTATMKNRMAVIRWWAEKVNKASVVQRRNEDYGIGEALTAKSRAYALEGERLAAIQCPLVRLALELQATFGLRREEAIKFKVSIADQSDRVVLRPSWTKGGRGRTIPIVSPKQRELLDRVRGVAGDGALIPDGKKYVEQLKAYEYQTLAAGLRNTHGLRHAWAQQRYQELTCWAAPAAGGPAMSAMSARDQRADRQARLKLSQELGHNRIEITKVYLG